MLLLEEMLPVMLCILAPSNDETEFRRRPSRETPVVTSFPFILGGLRVDRGAGAASSVMGKAERDNTIVHKDTMIANRSFTKSRVKCRPSC